MSRTSAIADGDSPRRCRCRGGAYSSSLARSLSGQDRCATTTARSAITFSVLERVEPCPCLSAERARVSLNRMEIDDMPTRLHHDMGCRRIVLPLRPSTRRAMLQGALAIALMAAAPPGTRAQQKAEKLLVQTENKPQIAAPRPRAGSPDADARLRAPASLTRPRPTAPSCPP
jgi:hypothetical protein